MEIEKETLEEMKRQSEDFLEKSKDKSKWIKHIDTQRSKITYEEEP